MANGHGGKRAGSGRPRKPLAQKILEGHPGKRKPKVLDIEVDGNSELEYPLRLAHTRGNLQFEGEPTSQDIWEETVAFLKPTGCLHLINPQLIERYSLYIARLYEAERVVTMTAIAYDKAPEETTKNKNLALNPGVEAGAKYAQLADAMWDRIWAIVKENSEKSFSKNPHEDFMDGLIELNLKGRA